MTERNMTVLGTAEADLYDWADTENSEGETPMDAARPAYRQVARELRTRIFDPAHDRHVTAGHVLPGQSILSGQVRADTSIVNRALAVLAAEGLIQVEHGRKTVVLERSRWRVDIEARLPDGTPDPELVRRAVTEALAAAGQPAIREATADLDRGRLLITMTVESADLPGAVTAALPVARMALGPLPIVVQSARGA
jgi:DNA-binding transcriptional regulator YhcF (GntR family)